MCFVCHILMKKKNEYILNQNIDFLDKIRINATSFFSHSNMSKVRTINDQKTFNGIQSAS